MHGVVGNVYLIILLMKDHCVSECHPIYTCRFPKAFSHIPAMCFPPCDRKKSVLSEKLLLSLPSPSISLAELQKSTSW